MAFRINYIQITNFKAFVGEPFKLDLDGKNLLLYGENGSGKSSIYWSLYTILQSCLKKQDATDAGKYFDPAHPEKLRNRYSGIGDESKIEIEFIDENHIAKRFTDSKDLINTAAPNEMFVFHTLALSDFINYKFLYSIFNFRNSQEADIFEVFERDIFPTMEFSESLYDIYEQPRNTQNASDWWNYLTKEAIGELDRYGNQAFKPVGGKYTQHGDYINKFNTMLKTRVANIQLKANELLKTKEFKLPLEINLEYRPMTFNKRLVRGSRKRDGKITPPQIILTAKLLDPTISEAERLISHPHTFLNEAKLARIALALRFAIININNVGAMARGAQILCIDDMLISLDMSNRLEVVEYILDTYSNNYQLIFMTHDKALYRIVENKIQQRNAAKQWLKKALYIVDAEISDTHIPHPELFDVESPLSKAKRHYMRHDYYACANALRRHCEKMMIDLLPRKMQLDSECNDLPLSGLFGKIPQLCQMYNMPDMLPDRSIYKDHILNPLSHDDATCNVYREEMKRCINEMERFFKYIKVKILKCDETPEQFKMTIGAEETIFEVNVEFDYIKDADGNKHYKEVGAKVISSTMAGFYPNATMKIKAIHKKMCEGLGMAEDARPEMYALITHLPDNMPLGDY